MNNWHNNGQWTDLPLQEMKYPVMQICRTINNIERRVQRLTRIYGDPYIVNDAFGVPRRLVDKYGNGISYITGQKREYTTWLDENHIFPTINSFDDITFLPISNNYTGPKGPIGFWPKYSFNGSLIRNGAGRVVREYRPVCLLDIIWKIQNWATTWLPNGVPGADCPWINNQPWTVITDGAYSVRADDLTTDGSLHAEPIDQCFTSKIRFGKSTQLTPYLTAIAAQAGVTEDYFEADPYDHFAITAPNWQLGNVLNRAMWQQLQDTFAGLGILSQSVESWNPYCLTLNTGVKAGSSLPTAVGAWSSAYHDPEDIACGNLDEEDRESPSCALFHAGANLNSFSGGNVQAEIVMAGTHKVRLPQYFPGSTTPMFLLKFAFLNAKNMSRTCYFKDNLGRRFSILPTTGQPNASRQQTVKLFETNLLNPSAEKTFSTLWGLAEGASGDGPPLICPLDEVPHDPGEDRESFIEAAKYGGQMAIVHDADLMMDASIILTEDLVDPEEVWFPRPINLSV